MIRLEHDTIKNLKVEAHDNFVVSSTVNGESACSCLAAKYWLRTYTTEKREKISLAVAI
jgi:hypothetical protein